MPSVEEARRRRKDRTTNFATEGSGKARCGIGIQARSQIQVKRGGCVCLFGTVEVCEIERLSGRREKDRSTLTRLANSNEPKPNASPSLDLNTGSGLSLHKLCFTNFEFRITESEIGVESTNEKKQRFKKEVPTQHKCTRAKQKPLRIHCEMNRKPDLSILRKFCR